MKNAFVQFATLLHKFYAEQPAEQMQVDALLAWVYEEDHAGRRVRVTDIVVMQRFGTLPTVNARLKRMAAQGLITTVVGTDRRTRVVQLTPKGVEQLENREALLREAAASELRRTRSASRST